MTESSEGDDGQDQDADSEPQEETQSQGGADPQSDTQPEQDSQTVPTANAEPEAGGEPEADPAVGPESEADVQGEESQQKEGAVTIHNAKDLGSDENQHTVTILDGSGNKITQGHYKVLDANNQVLAEGDLDSGTVSLSSATDPQSISLQSDGKTIVVNLQSQDDEQTQDQPQAQETD
jgi:hypothetical protein